MKYPSQVSTRWENYYATKQCRITSLRFKRTALIIRLKIIHALLHLHTSWYNKLLYLLLLKRRKWSVIRYRKTFFLLAIVSSAFCYYLVQMLIPFPSLTLQSARDLNVPSPSKRSKALFMILLRCVIVTGRLCSLRWWHHSVSMPARV